MTEERIRSSLQANRDVRHDELTGRLRHVRVLLDSAAPQLAHETLAPLMQIGAREWPDSELRVEALTLYLRSCVALGRAAELSSYIAELDQHLEEQADFPTELRIRALGALAHLSLDRAEYQAVLDRCAQVSAIDLNVCSTAAAFGILLLRQCALYRLGRYGEAESVCGWALSLAERDRDDALQGNVWMWMANLCRLQGQLTPSLQMYLRAAQHHTRAGDFVGMTRDLLNQAAVLNRLGRPESARTTYAEATRLAGMSADRITILRTLIGQGMTSLRLGDYAIARRHLLTAWLDARRIKAAREICLCAEFLGELQIATGQTAKARRTLRMCRRLATRLAPEGDLIAELGIRESFLELTEQHWSAAVERARESIDLCLEKGMAWEEAQARRLAGSALGLRGELPAARAELACARDLFQRMGECLEVELAKSWLVWLEGDRTMPAPALHPGQMPARAPEASATVTATEPAPSIEESPRAVLRRLRRRSGPIVRTEPAPSDPDTVARPNPADKPAEPLDPIWDSLGLVTRSAKMTSVLTSLQQFAKSGSNILILGETGTGKELLARGVHAFSGRAGRLIPFNCAGCTPSLVESELFGVERGAFTGADRRRPGLVRRASEGTLFLDEVGDLPIEAQGLLLRFLDSGEVRALGSHAIRSVKLGVVAATLHPLDQSLPEQRFRPDLYYRLSEGFVRVPPLRERSEDLELLIRQLWLRTHDGPPPAWLLDDAHLQVLFHHQWMGNIRELRHFLRRLVARSLKRAPSPGELADLLCEGSEWYLDKTPHPVELRDALAISHGNRRRAATLLRISRPRLYRLMKKYGIEDFNETDSAATED